jgi:hypothetical protein
MSPTNHLIYKKYLSEEKVKKAGSNQKDRKLF